MAQESPDFENMISMTPAMGPLNADEEPTAEEMDAYEDISAEVIKFINGDNNAAVLAAVSNTPELYQGISQAAFQILLATKQKYEQGGQKVPPAALFGEGGAIHTAVDELFQMASAAGVPGADDQDQYSAAMMNVMVLAGDYIEKASDDTSIAEAQDLLIDVEAASGEPQRTMPPMQDDGSLQSAIQRSLDAQNQSLAPENIPPPPGEEEMMMEEDPNMMPPPQQGGGGILNV